jgi:hypothetical protein
LLPNTRNFRQDLRAVARLAGIQRGTADGIVEQVLKAVCAWPTHADAAKVPAATRDGIHRDLRLIAAPALGEPG